jgi:hypothetical protein
MWLAEPIQGSEYFFAAGCIATGLLDKKKLPRPLNSIGSFLSGKILVLQMVNPLQCKGSYVKSTKNVLISVNYKYVGQNGF